MNLLNKRVLLITKTGAKYGGILAKQNGREIWLTKLLIFDKNENVIAAPKSRNSRRFPIEKVQELKELNEI